MGVRYRQVLLTLLSISISQLAAIDTIEPLPEQRPLNGPQDGDSERGILPEVDPYSEESLFTFHRDLVNIDSTSEKEHEIGVFLEKYLQSLNFSVERQYIPPPPRSSSSISENTEHASRFNVFAYPPSYRSTSFLLTSHMDAVPPFYPYHFDPKTTLISGRGTVDDKACIATQLHTILRLRHSAPEIADRISLLFVTGEEVSGDGMKAASHLAIPWRSVIFGEPTEHKLASGHKGFISFHLTVHGQVVHSGYPWLGHSATQGLLKALNALNAVRWPSSPKYGNSTLNIGRITGGAAANVVPASAKAEISIRIAHGSPATVRDLVRSTIAGIADERIELDFVGAAYGPVDIDHDVAGFETVTVNYGTDVPNLTGGHYKKYLYGPGTILVAHGDHEGLYRRDLVRAVDDYERLVRVLAEREV